MKLKVCPCCKRPFAPEVDLGGPVRQRTYDYIVAHPEGVTRYQVMEHVYRDDPNGGPLHTNIVAVVVSKINRQLAERNLPLRIRSSGGPGSRYKAQFDDRNE